MCHSYAVECLWIQSIPFLSNMQRKRDLHFNVHKHLLRLKNLTNSAALSNTFTAFIMLRCTHFGTADKVSDIFTASITPLTLYHQMLLELVHTTCTNITIHICIWQSSNSHIHWHTREEANACPRNSSSRSFPWIWRSIDCEYARRQTVCTSVLVIWVREGWRMGGVSDFISRCKCICLLRESCIIVYIVI